MAVQQEAAATPSPGDCSDKVGAATVIAIETPPGMAALRDKSCVIDLGPDTLCAEECLNDGLPRGFLAMGRNGYGIRLNESLQEADQLAFERREKRFRGSGSRHVSRPR
jgi:hypothetical protein